MDAGSIDQAATSRSRDRLLAIEEELNEAGSDGFKVATEDVYPCSLVVRRCTMRVAFIVVFVMFASATAAQAMCEDDMRDVRLKVERAQTTNPSPQTGAAANELKRYDERTGSVIDEIDCRNTIARVERALRAPPPADTGQATGPINEPARSVEEQAQPK
jgi:hypothetical protein